METGLLRVSTPLVSSTVGWSCPTEGWMVQRSRFEKVGTSKREFGATWVH